MEDHRGSIWPPIAVGAALLMCSCPPPPLPPVERPYPPPTAQALLARLEQQRWAVSSLRSEARVDYRGAGSERVKVSMEFLVRAPDQLRIAAESPLLGAVATLASDGQAFELLDLRGNRFLTGEASACNLGRLLRVELAPADLVALLSGGVPALPAVTSAEVSWDKSGGGREVLQLRAADGQRQTVRFDARDRRWDVVQAERRGADGQVMWRIEHADFADAGGGLRLPGRSEVAQPTRGADARVRFRAREPGAEVPPGVFRLQAPSAMPVERVRCGPAQDGGAAG